MKNFVPATAAAKFVTLALAAAPTPIRVTLSSSAQTTPSLLAHTLFALAATFPLLSSHDAHAQPFPQPVADCRLNYYKQGPQPGTGVHFNGGLAIYAEGNSLRGGMSNNYDSAFDLKCTRRQVPAQGSYAMIYTCKGKGWSFDRLEPGAPAGLEATLTQLPDGRQMISTRVSKPYGGKKVNLACLPGRD